ncbi:MAG: DUF5060 domain-containing protein [Acidobacteriota bacterium]
MGQRSNRYMLGGIVAVVTIFVFLPVQYVPAQTLATLPTCTVAKWSTCDLVFDLQPGEDGARADLRAEFRSPHRNSRTLRAFHDGQLLVIRFAPDEDGAWDYRVTSSIKRLDAQVGHLTATASNAPGFVHVANVHHFQTSNLQPHLWVSMEIPNFAAMPSAEFDAMLVQRASEKLTHLRVMVDTRTDLKEAEARMRAMNAKGLVVDVVLGELPANRAERQRYVTEMVARFSGFNMTWAGTVPFERTAGARSIVVEMGRLIAQLDPYKQVRTSLADVTSASLLDDGRGVGDGWMNVLSYGVSDPNIGVVEHQVTPLPAVNTGIQSRADLWNATMNGQYPASGSASDLKVWAEFMSKNRHWELEPYFDVQGGRAVALPEIEDELGGEGIEAVEYIVYVEKPGPVELTVGRHGYDVAWINPATGERIKAKDTRDKEGKKFSATPPDLSHDWILQVSREGRKDGMLKSYKFESRRFRPAAVETNLTAIPYDIAEPSGDISLRVSPYFKLKSTRANREPRNLLVEWTADVVTSGEGFRVVGTGIEGTMRMPAPLTEALAGRPSTVLAVQVRILNSAGKVYVIDHAFRLQP